MEDMFDDQLLMNMIPAENYSSSAAVCASAPAQWPHVYFPSCTEYYTNSLVCIITFTPANQNHVSFNFLLPRFDFFFKGSMNWHLKKCVFYSMNKIQYNPKDIIIGVYT